jgi:hypothetical protein
MSLDGLNWLDRMATPGKLSRPEVVVEKKIFGAFPTATCTVLVY